MKCPVTTLDNKKSGEIELSDSIFGIDVRKVVEFGVTPRINTGIAHREAGVGQVGAGLVRPPVVIFEEALVAFAEHYGV